MAPRDPNLIHLKVLIMKRGIIENALET